MSNCLLSLDIKKFIFSVINSIYHQVNRLQVDNQLPGAVFPVVLHPVPLPKSIAVDSSPKPFLEVSIMQRHFEQQSFALIKYFKVGFFFKHNCFSLVFLCLCLSIKPV